jgi:glycosyltransferase involved in cell wall biosynthesis
VRILYHHRTLADGAEGVHIQAMVDAFRRLGHTVEVMGGEADVSRRQRGLVTRVRAMAPRLAFELAAAAYNAVEFAEVRRRIREFSPDLVYKRHSRFDVGALAAARAAHVPTVLEVNAVFTVPPYATFEPMSAPALARAFERRALQTATVVTAVSTPLAAQVRAVADADVIVVPNGADPDRFDPSRIDGRLVRATHHLQQRLVVGWVGILREWHGLDLLLDAIQRVPSATLLVVGDGPARQAFERHAERLGVLSRIVVTGRVPHDEVPAHLAAMDVAVVADERTGVASPMKLVEYMAMGIAVAVPRAANLRDLVTEGVDGLMFDAGSATSLAAALERLAADDGLRQALGRRARAKVESDLNWKSVARRVLGAVAVHGGRR